MATVSASHGIAVFAPLIRTKRLTMTLFNPETDTQFIADLWNSYGALGVDSFVWGTTHVDRLMRNTTLSPRFCLGLKAPGPSAYIIRLGDESGTPVGQIILSERHPEVAPDFGYGILPTYRRQGFASEAAPAVLKYWLEDFGLTEITGFCRPENVLSNSMLVKLGFERAGDILLDEATVMNAYVRPGMKSFKKERTGFSRWGIDK